MSNKIVEEATGTQHQITLLGNRIVEFNKVDHGYVPRKWNNFTNIKEFCDFAKKNKVELFENAHLSLVTQEGSEKIVQLVIVPDYAEPLNEVVFNSAEETQEYITKEKLLPTLNIAPEEHQNQVKNFFDGKECFFPNAKEIYLDFEKEFSETDGDPKAQFLLQKKYENKIIDILFEQNNK